MCSVSLTALENSLAISWLIKIQLCGISCVSFNFILKVNLLFLYISSNQICENRFLFQTLWWWLLPYFSPSLLADRPLGLILSPREHNPPPQQTLGTQHCAGHLLTPSCQTNTLRTIRERRSRWTGWPRLFCFGKSSRQSRAQIIR